MCCNYRIVETDNLIFALNTVGRLFSQLVYRNPVPIFGRSDVFEVGELRIVF